MKKIIIPIINTWIWDLVMLLPLLKNIENNSKIKCTILINKEFYKTILEYSFIDLNKFNIIYTNNISSIKLWINFRKKYNIILVPTIGLKPLILWKLLWFQIFSKPLIIKNKYISLWINTPLNIKEHDIKNNINLLNIFYQKYPSIKSEIKQCKPLLNNTILKEKIIFIHPWFDWNSIFNKDWWIKNWIKLIEKLYKEKKEYKIKIIIWKWWFEEKYLNEYIKLERTLKSVSVIYNKSLDYVINQLSNWEYLINTDSWIWHIAWALWIKTITIFWVTDENHIWVYSKKAINIRYKNSFPCFSQWLILNTNCIDNWWIKKINIENILKNIT